MKKLNSFIGLLIILHIMVSTVIAQPIISSGLDFERADTLQDREITLYTDLLDHSLYSLAETDRKGRMAGGYVLLGLGIGSGIGGLTTLAIGEGDDSRIVGYSLLGGAVLLSGLSLVPFKVKSETEHLYDDFREALIAQGQQYSEQHFYYWDRRFEELAEISKVRRITGGIISIAGGGITSLLLVDGSDKEKINTFIWPVLAGISAIVIRSDAERRFDSYSRAKKDILGNEPGASVYIGITPAPGKGVLGMISIAF